MVAFTYRPKYVDIRVNKPDAAERDRAPQERACDHIGCRRAGQHRAPKSRGQDADFWWFCASHAAEYNRGWDYFSGMSAAEMDQFAEGVVYGHRPTWSFQASRGDREAAAKRKFYPFRGESGVFEDGARRPQRRAVSRLHRAALETLGLNEDADAAAIRMRYADLVKRFHPDSNGGDRSAEAQLHKVIRAYQSLKASGWVT